MTSFSPKVPIFPSKKYFFIFYLFFVQCLKKNDFFYFFIFWSIFGTGTSSEKGQCSKYGRNFEKKKLDIRFHIKFKENSQNFMPIGLKIKKLLKENQQGGHIVPPSRNWVKLHSILLYLFSGMLGFGDVTN